MDQSGQLAGLAFEMGFAFLILLRVADLAELDGDDPVLGLIERGPDKTLPPVADLLEQLVLQELETWMEIAQPDGGGFNHK